MTSDGLFSVSKPVNRIILHKVSGVHRLKLLKLTGFDQSIDLYMSIFECCPAHIGNDSMVNRPRSC